MNGSAVLNRDTGDALWLHSPFGPPLRRKKLALRLQEAAEAMGAANARNASLERARLRLQLELGDTLSDLGQARSAAAALSQKQQQFDRRLDDWRRKHEEAQALLEVSRKEARALGAQLLELRHSLEEGAASQEALRRENQQLRGALCGDARGARSALGGRLRHRRLSILTALLGLNLASFNTSFGFFFFKRQILFSLHEF